MTLRGMISQAPGMGWLAPKASSEPLVRVTDQPFRGGRAGRASAAFEGQRQHINSAIRKGGALLRERSRFLCRENGLAISAKSIWTSYAVGCGMLPSPVGLTSPQKKAVLAAFYRWCRISDFDGLLDFFGQQAGCSDEVFEAGELFFRKIRSAGRPMRLQMLPSEQLPYSVLNPRDMPEGHTVRLGIEFDTEGQRAAFHFLKHHPGDLTVSTADRVQTIRVPADEVLHVFKVVQPGQLRGLPATLGAIIPANKLDEFDDAAIERAISASKVSGVIKKGATDRGSDGSVLGSAKSNGDGSGNLDFEVGTILELETDEDWVTVSPPDPGSGYAEFIYHHKSKACAAMGVPYLEATGDLRRAPFSAVRAGRMPFKRRIEQFQHLTLAVQLLQPVWEEWIREALLRGDIDLPPGSPRDPAAYSNIRWMGPKWEYVEPLKDRQAEKLAVDELFVPRSDIIAERGEDAEEIDERIAQDQARERDLGLTRPKPVAAAQSDEDKPEPPEDDDR